MMQITLDLNSMADYQRFLRIKSLPSYRFTGRQAAFPDEYAERLGLDPVASRTIEYEPLPALMDFQADIARLAITKQKFGVFADCGLGKTLILLEFARHAANVLPPSRCVLIISPLMVIGQTLAECAKFYGDSLPIDRVAAGSLQKWLFAGEGRIGITNYEAIKEGIQPGRLGALILDESSLLKSHYGKWGTRIIRLGRGLDWKLCCTGTPAPNDRIEYANHAVFFDAFPNVNSFLARYFVNRGQTGERWELKPHALEPFYRAISHWCIFVDNPAAYGWNDLDTSIIPPIHIHHHYVELTQEQVALTMKMSGALFPVKTGGIASRASYASIAKGWYRDKEVPTNKPEAILELIRAAPGESIIVWCLYNKEQEILERWLPDAVSLKGTTAYETRQAGINAFKAGDVKVLISKPKILGLGLNLHVATQQIFSGLQDSYEGFYQAIKRSNRIGSTRPLNVHIPYTDLEEPMIRNVMRKAAYVNEDSREQERIFRKVTQGNGRSTPSR
jgi:superfamily II DNA or RNA helicase